MMRKNFEENSEKRFEKKPLSKFLKKKTLGTKTRQRKKTL